jgi:hypothetical protein
VSDVSCFVQVSARAVTPQLLGRMNGNSSSTHTASNNSAGSLNSVSSVGSQTGARGSESSSSGRGIAPISHPNAAVPERGTTGSRSGSRGGGSGSNPRMISSVSISGDDGSIQVSSSLTSLPTSSDTSSSAKATSTHASKRSPGYALIGGGRGAPGDLDPLQKPQNHQTATADFMNDDQYIGLCRQLEVEIKARKLLESQVITLI